MKAVGQEVDLLATVVWGGQLVMAMLALNCLVIGNPFDMGAFLLFYVFVMVSRAARTGSTDRCNKSLTAIRCLLSIRLTALGYHRRASGRV